MGRSQGSGQRRQARRHVRGCAWRVLGFLGSTFDDPDHSRGERREIIVGHSERHRLLVVSFVERAGKIRIISARPATGFERRDDEQNKP